MNKTKYMYIKPRSTFFLCILLNPTCIQTYHFFLKPQFGNMYSTARMLSLFLQDRQTGRQADLRYHHFCAYGYLPSSMLSTDRPNVMKVDAVSCHKTPQIFIILKREVLMAVKRRALQRRVDLHVGTNVS